MRTDSASDSKVISAFQDVICHGHGAPGAALRKLLFQSVTREVAMNADCIGFKLPKPNHGSS